MPSSSSKNAIMFAFPSSIVSSICMTVGISFAASYAVERGVAEFIARINPCLGFGDEDFDSSFWSYTTATTSIFPGTTIGSNG